SARDMRINRTRLMVYRYVAADRIHKHTKQRGEGSFAVEPPTLKLPPVPKSIKNGKHYVVVETLFSSPVQGWGLLNWRAFLWDHVDSPNFGFSHSAGDSLPAILNDPRHANSRVRSFHHVPAGQHRPAARPSCERVGLG